MGQHQSDLVPSNCSSLLPGQRLDLNYALREACFHDDVETAEHLINLGADARFAFKEENGQTALHFAAQHSSAAMTKLLILTAGADVLALDLTGRTPFDYVMSRTLTDPRAGLPHAALFERFEPCAFVMACYRDDYQKLRQFVRNESTCVFRFNHEANDIRVAIAVKSRKALDMLSELDPRRYQTPRYELVFDLVSKPRKTSIVPAKKKRQSRVRSQSYPSFDEEHDKARAMSCLTIPMPPSLQLLEEITNQDNNNSGTCQQDAYQSLDLPRGGQHSPLNVYDHLHR